jgi:hypothetical protein
MPVQQSGGSLRGRGNSRPTLGSGESVQDLLVALDGRFESGLESSVSPAPLDVFGKCLPNFLGDRHVFNVFGVSPRTGEHDRNLRVAHSETTRHVGQPGSTTWLGSKEVWVVAFDHDCQAADLGQALQLEGKASIGMVQ